MFAKLISPEGDVLNLTDEQYVKVKTILFPTEQTPEEILDELCGKYADGTNLEEWYMAEKAKERELEDTKYERSMKQ
jgi:hypothetical protein